MRCLLIPLMLLCLAGALPRALCADTTTASEPDANSGEQLSLKERFIDSLPPVIGDGLDIDVWGWSDFLQTNYENQRYYDAELVLGITKSFDQRVAISAQGNFIDADGQTRWELEQGYASIKLSDSTQTLLTIGKFNANIGAEQRDFWNRTTATTSLLFAAKPQDLLGVMITQPIGDSGLRVRSFLSEGFESGYDFNQCPSAGITAQYTPNRKLEFAATGWVGPGLVGYEGRHIQQPFDRAYSGDSDGDPGASVVENWEGPNLYAERGATLYFADGSCIIRPTPDLTLTGECMVGTTGTDDDRFGWAGFMLMANYDVTDQLHVYGRWSYLNDSDMLITGTEQRCTELSAGAGYQIFDAWELRGEYRHDFSNATPDFDTVSVDLTFTY
jgi:hypothetical protein